MCCKWIIKSIDESRKKAGAFMSHLWFYSRYRAKKKYSDYLSYDYLTNNYIRSYKNKRIN